jgi:ankyrin repeat protein
VGESDRSISPARGVAYDTFDSSIEERRDEKQVYKLIQKQDHEELRVHLEKTKNKYEIMRLFDSSGYTPLHYAAYKNNEQCC